MTWPRSAALLALLVAFGGRTLPAQGPEADWRTLETPHFRVHYPQPAEAWARRMAARLEPLRARVGELVGYTVDARVDVVVADPVGEANGSAWPILGAPRLVLWTSPPGAATTLGRYDDWAALLVGHEQAHLAHLLRPSRNPWQRTLARFVPVGPVARRAPRWAIEGYATMLEGRLTGSGRPGSALRAAILREWARVGRLPSYRALAGDRDAFLGMSMAYLVGSSYLEWLETRPDAPRLEDVWARLTAREVRSFEAAFEGVFGARPDELYGRFVAEVTHEALRVEEALAPAREGEPWLDLPGSTGAPALSPDGSRLALVVRAPRRSPRIAIYATADDDRVAQRREEAIASRRARDPEDVPAVVSGPPPRDPLVALDLGAGGAVGEVRWADERTLIVPRAMPGSDGRRRWDLFRWRPDLDANGRCRSAGLERLTVGADLFAADPAPGGAWAVAVRGRWGVQEPVRVGLPGGEARPLAAASVEVAWDAPRLSPDATRVAVLRHRGAGWRPVVIDLRSGELTELPTPEVTFLGPPAWSPDGSSLLLPMATDGPVDLWTLPADGSAPPRPVSRTVGALLAATASPAGDRLFALALGPDGLAVRRLTVDRPPLPTAPTLPGSPTVLPRPERSPPSVSPPLPGPGRPYGWGRPEALVLPGGRWSPAGHAAELVARTGDLLGRWDLVGAVAEGASGGPDGGRLGFTWRGSAITLAGSAASLREEPSRQPVTVPGLVRRLDMSRLGGEVEARMDRWWGTWEVGGALGGGAWRVEPDAGEAVRRTEAWVTLSVRRPWQRGAWRVDTMGEVRAWAGSGGGSRDGVGGRLELRAGTRDRALRLELAHREASGDLADWERLRVGGAATSVRAGGSFGAILEPALPTGALIGERWDGLRVALETGLPVAPFWARHRMEGGPDGGELDVVGVEAELTLPPLPLLRLPGARISAGVATALDAPWEEELQAWLALAWVP